MGIWACRILAPVPPRRPFHLGARAYACACVRSGVAGPQQPFGYLIPEDLYIQVGVR